ncbi:MAG: hypothetical protein GY861_03820 [bacterium]|nr:hypothetical protein [bacterium]
MKTVRDISLLTFFEKEGFITLHHQTGKKVTTPFGAKITAYYIDGLVNGWFKYKNKTYTKEYASGSFNPYLMES